MPTLVQHDACELLDADHIATKHLFVEYARLAFAGAGTGARAASTRTPSADQRPTLARKICSELTVHAQIEEEIFYPALRDVIDVPELLDEAHAEHQRVKELVAQIEGLSEADAAMDDLVSQLARAVENHVKEERDLLFPKARAAEGLDLDELGARMKERQQQLESQAA
ncbi:MAG TPA: hemerythrin domain-containing protein [Ramlibacter sp.]